MPSNSQKSSIGSNLQQFSGQKRKHKPQNNSTTPFSVAAIYSFMNLIVNSYSGNKRFESLFCLKGHQISKKSAGYAATRNIFFCQNASRSSENGSLTYLLAASTNVTKHSRVAGRVIRVVPSPKIRVIGHSLEHSGETASHQPAKNGAGRSKALGKRSSEYVFC